RGRPSCRGARGVAGAAARSPGARRARAHAESGGGVGELRWVARHPGAGLGRRVPSRLCGFVDPPRTHQVMSLPSTSSWSPLTVLRLLARRWSLVAVLAALGLSYSTLVVAAVLANPLAFGVGVVFASMLDMLVERRFRPIVAL